MFVISTWFTIVSFFSKWRKIQELQNVEVHDNFPKIWTPRITFTTILNLCEGVSSCIFDTCPQQKGPVSNLGPDNGHQETVFDISLSSSGKHQKVPQTRLQSFVFISFEVKDKVINIDVMQSTRNRWSYTPFIHKLGVWYKWVVSLRLLHLRLSGIQQPA